MMKKSDFDLQHQQYNTDSKIVASLERISQAFRVLLWQESKDLSLTPIQIQVLIFLLYHGDEKKTVSYLAEEFNMTKATISDTIKTLGQKKLISREYEREDLRSYTIQLTKKGKEVAEKTARFSAEIHAPVHQLHPDDKESLLLSLMNIIRHLNKTGVITIQRMCMTCSYYRSDGNHFCSLLNEPLQVEQLRIDCPEHKQII